MSPASETPMRRTPPLEFRNPATVLTTAFDNSLFTPPVRISCRKEDLNSTLSLSPPARRALTSAWRPTSAVGESIKASGTDHGLGHQRARILHLKISPLATRSM